MKRIIKFLVLVLLVFGFSSVSVQASSNPQRIFGNDRVKTSIEISKKAYTSSNTVILAGYGGQVDALSGTLLAYAKKAPMLYTGIDKNKVDDLVLGEIKRLGAKEIYILGGETVVSREIENSLSSSSYKVTRIKGLRREETAINMAKEVMGENIPEVFLAIGYGDYADALAIGPVSGRHGIPILLTKSNVLPEDTKEALKNLGVRNVTIIGGKSVIGTDVENELKTMGIPFKRVFGSDRIETAINIANTYMGNPSGVVIANGWKFADAVVGGYLAAKENSPILLSKDKIIDIKNLDYIANKKIQTYILGGESVIYKGVSEDIDVILNKKDFKRLLIEGTGMAGATHVIKAEVNSSQKLLYRFHIKDWSTEKWTLIQNYSTKNTVNWRPSKNGKYSYLVAVKDVNSNNDKDISFSEVITINPTIHYNVSNYGYDLNQALEKQVGKNKSYYNLKEIATKDEVKKYLDPNGFLQFEPESEGTVTTSSLNIRSGPSIQNGIIAKTTMGIVHKIFDESNGWYLIQKDGVRGWVLGDHIKAVDKHIRTVEITSDIEVIVRKEPTTTSNKLTSVTKGNKYVVLDEKSGWFKINVGTNIAKNIGWITENNAKYVNDVPKSMYQFMILSGEAGVSVTQMNNELKNKGILHEQGQSFLTAAKKYDVNELYLMVHAMHETANGASVLANGVLVSSVSQAKKDKDGKILKDKDNKTIMEQVPVEPRKVYNMYGIGARDEDAIKLGSERAYELKWFTPEEAIIGGAGWISSNYLNNPSYKQNTIYKMKWNPSDPGTHQYATDVGWPIKQARIEVMMQIYRRLDGKILRFDIPKYR